MLSQIPTPQQHGLESVLAAKDLYLEQPRDMIIHFPSRRKVLLFIASSYSEHYNSLTSASVLRPSSGALTCICIFFSSFFPPCPICPGVPQKTHRPKQLVKKYCFEERKRSNPEHWQAQCSGIPTASRVSL